jgi:Putative zinc-finger
MTEWTTKPMRHIPEDELHAYLDQALSRSQCAEIETHLSTCRACQVQRASVAALRDRTTAVLSRLAPRPLIIPPDYLSLREQHKHRLVVAIWKERIRRTGIWAAAVVGAVGSGWIARSVMDPHQAPVVSVPVAEAAGPVPPSTVATPPDDGTTELERQAIPVPIQERRPVSLVSRRPADPEAQQQEIVPAPALRPASLVVAAAYSPAQDFSVRPAEPSGEGNGVFSRIWREVSWEDALQIAGSGLPFIEGLSVVGVLLQPGEPGERPMVIVAQQDQSGEILLSIEGPTAKVSDVLQRQGSSDTHASDPTRTPPDYLEGRGGIRRSLRTLVVTGRLPVDSLNALARLATIR